MAKIIGRLAKSGVDSLELFITLTSRPVLQNHPEKWSLLFMSLPETEKRLTATGD